MSSFGPHFIAGAVAGSVGSAATYCLASDVNWMCALPMVAGIAGALTPDMDIKSKSSKIMYLFFTGISITLFAFGYTGWAFFVLLYSLIPQFFGHRGFIHSFVFGLISTVGLGFICAYNNVNIDIAAGICATYFFGFLTHIVLDEK